MTILKADAWLIIEPVRKGYDGQMVGLELDRMLKSKPKLGVREVAVHVFVEVDSKIFVNPEPEVTVRINDARQLVTPEVDVEVQPQPEDGAAGDESV